MGEWVGERVGERVGEWVGEWVGESGSTEKCHALYQEMYSCLYSTILECASVQVCMLRSINSPQGKHGVVCQVE